MPSQRQATVCEHPRDCECDDCVQSWYDAIWCLWHDMPPAASEAARMRLIEDLEGYAASDPEPATEVWNG